MLSLIEARVLGGLLEKERTTPDQYPLTTNALVLACNQSTSREPVMAVEADDAEAAIAQLKSQGLARLVHPSHGRSATRFRQVADEVYGWSAAQSAVMAVLLLRGPQTVTELRTRTERQHRFGSTEEVEATLGLLAAADASAAGPMVQLLERGAGQKESRWQQLLADEVAPVARAVVAPAGGLADRVEALEARVATLEAALGDLL